MSDDSTRFRAFRALFFFLPFRFSIHRIWQINSAIVFFFQSKCASSSTKLLHTIIIVGKSRNEPEIKAAFRIITISLSRLTWLISTIIIWQTSCHVYVKKLPSRVENSSINRRSYLFIVFRIHFVNSILDFIAD